MASGNEIPSVIEAYNILMRAQVSLPQTINESPSSVMTCIGGCGRLQRSFCGKHGQSKDWRSDKNPTVHFHILVQPIEIIQTTAYNSLICINV